MDNSNSSINNTEKKEMDIEPSLIVKLCGCSDQPKVEYAFEMCCCTVVVLKSLFTVM